jgi:hypothetical protein
VLRFFLSGPNARAAALRLHAQHAHVLRLVHDARDELRVLCQILPLPRKLGWDLIKPISNFCCNFRQNPYNLPYIIPITIKS